VRDLLLGLWIEARCGFIEQEHLRPLCQHPRQQGLALLPAGEASDRSCGQIENPYFFQIPTSFIDSQARERSDLSGKRNGPTLAYRPIKTTSLAKNGVDGSKKRSCGR